MNITKKKILSFFIIVFSLSLIYFVTPVLTNKTMAQSDLIQTQEGLDEVGKAFGQRGEPDDVRVTITKIIVLFLQFLGIIFLVLILFAGFQWMMSGGNEEKVGKAKKLLINAVIGLVIILVSWLLARYLLIMFSRVANNAVNYTEYVY